MPLHRSGSRRVVLRKQFLVFGLVLCVLIGMGVAWQRLLHVKEQRALTETGEPGILAELSAAARDVEAQLAGGVRVSDMVREVLTRARKTLPGGESRPSVFVLGESGSADAIPLLESIVQDKEEDDLLRGDALHALFYLDEDKATALAKQFKNQGSHLASIAERIITRDPVMLQRRDNVKKVAESLPFTSPER